MTTDLRTDTANRAAYLWTSQLLWVLAQVASYPECGPAGADQIRTKHNCRRRTS
jgi:hypothetical protein